MKIVINGCHGGFGLSDEATRLYLDRKGYDYTEMEGAWGADFTVEGIEYFYDGDIARDDEVLVGVVEELGEKANTRSSFLKVIDIPDDVEWVVEDYDGQEWISEVHRTWS